MSKPIFDFRLASKKVQKIKRIRDISLWFVVASMIVVIFMSSFSAMLYNSDFYANEYKKNGVYERYGKNLTVNVTINIFNFFKNKEDIGFNLGGFFTDNEKSHMYDVKVLINSFMVLYRIAMAVAIIAFIVLFFNSWNILRDLGKVFLFTGLACIFIILLFYTLNFDFLFIKFHEIFFTGNYLFEESSNLIGLFPLQFFGDITYKIIFFSLMKSIIFAVSGAIIILCSPSAFSEYYSR